MRTPAQIRASEKKQRANMNRLGKILELRAAIRYQEVLRNHSTPSEALKAVYKIQSLQEQLRKLV